MEYTSIKSNKSGKLHPEKLHLPTGGPYKPRTGRCTNHAPAILAALALIYSMHRLLVVWISVAHFHFCSLLHWGNGMTNYRNGPTAELYSTTTDLFWTGLPILGRLFINISDSLTTPCLVYKMAMYTIYGRCGQYGRRMFIHCPVRPVRGLYGPAHRRI